MRTSRLLVLAALATVGICRSAWADTFGAQAHVLTGTTHVDGLELDVAPGVGEPDVLRGRDPKLVGYGSLRGADLRLDGLLDGTRVGLGVSYFWLDEVSLGTRSLESGIDATASAIRGSSVELFLGREIGQGPVYPYLDARGTFSLLQVNVDTHAEPYGHVGTTQYVGWRFGLGPRFGALIPIGHSLTADVAVFQRLVGGVEETTFGVGLGYWENDRTDEFSQSLRGHSWRGEI